MNTQTNEMEICTSTNTYLNVYFLKQSYDTLSRRFTRKSICINSIQMKDRDINETIKTVKEQYGKSRYLTNKQYENRERDGVICYVEEFKGDVVDYLNKL